MVRQYRPRSSVKKAAANAPTIRGKLKEKKQLLDPTRTTFGKQQKTAPAQAVPEASQTSKKGQFEKIPGTRVQQLKTGVYVRIVEQDKKQFPPENVRACRQHLRKLQEKAEEVARIRGETIPTGPLAKEAGKKRKSEKAADKAEVASLSKKARKQKDWEERQKRQAEEHAAKSAAEGRHLVSEAWCDAEVVRREKGFVWVKLLGKQYESVLSGEVLQRLRKDNEISREEAGTVNPFCGGVQGDLLRLTFGDVADSGLDLRLKAKLSVRIFRTGSGAVGACDAKAQGEASPEELPPVEEEAPKQEELETKTPVVTEAGPEGEEAIQQHASTVAIKPDDVAAVEESKGVAC